ncbi:MAG: polyprenyl synthetase family protein [Fimbriimonadales bacterium]
MTTAYLDAARELAGDLAMEMASDVQACEAVMAERLGSDVETVENIAEHVFGAGGKRLRPLFVSLAARATGLPFSRARVAAIGACMEMIHTATLIHDDVIDHAATRRGRPTASMLFGSTASILTGDVLLAKAMQVLAEDGDLRIIRIVSKAVAEMAEGEVLEVQSRGDFDLSEEKHVEILRRKTAVLIACCCEAGALVAGADGRVASALAGYGEAIGIGYQIADDLLDFQSLPEVSGKPRATDFNEGCATLPLIYLRGRLAVDEAAYVRSKFGNGVTDSDLETIAGWMLDREAFASAKSRAEAYSDTAKEALNDLPHNAATQLLANLGQILVCRDS